MNRIGLATLLLCCAGLATPCQAQFVGGPVGLGLRVAGGYNPYRVYGPYGYGGVGGARSGTADIIRAQGEYAESYGQGLINSEEARSKYIDNQKKWLEVYYERKKMGEQYKKEQADERNRATQKWLATREPGAPDPLSPRQLDPSTGKVFWPTGLQSQEFADLRVQLENEFDARAHASSGASNGDKINQLAREMQKTLKANIRDMTPNQYIAAKKFLDSMAYEGLNPSA